MSITQIPLDSLKQSFLINEGAYCGDLFDFLESNEIEYLKTLITKVKEYATKERNNELYCRYNYHLLKDEVTGINANDNFKHSIKLSEVAERDAFVKENDREITQKWFEFFGVNEECKYFNEISKNEIHSLIMHECLHSYHFDFMKFYKLPKYKYYKYFNTALVEGFAFYMETYCDDYDDNNEFSLLRKIRLVVDTGINYYGWTYKKAYDFMKYYLPNKNFNNSSLFSNT
jgi:hypothetical protein